MVISPNGFVTRKSHHAKAWREKYLLSPSPAVADPAVFAVGAGEGRGEAEAEGDPLASGYYYPSPSLPLFPLFGPLPFGYFYGGGVAKRQIWPKGHLRP